MLQIGQFLWCHSGYSWGWKSYRVVLISLIHRCGTWFTSRGAILVAELSSLEIVGFCVSWPTEVRKLADEYATHMGKIHHDVGGHSIFYFICTRWHTWKLTHNWRLSSMIDETKWLDPHQVEDHSARAFTHIDTRYTWWQSLQECLPTFVKISL